MSCRHRQPFTERGSCCLRGYERQRKVVPHLRLFPQDGREQVYFRVNLDIFMLDQGTTLVCVYNCRSTLKLGTDNDYFVLKNCKLATHRKNKVGNSKHFFLLLRLP